MRRDVLVSAIIVAAVVCGWFAVLGTAYWFIDHSEPANTRKVFEGPLALLASHVEGQPRAAWETELEAQSEAFGFPVRRVPERASLRGFDAEASRGETLVFVETEGLEGQISVARELRDGSLLVAGPLPDEPPPPLWVIVTMLLLAGTITVGGSMLLSVPLARRMRALATAAADIQSGNLTRRVAEGPQDVVGQFARTFNAMAATVESHVERQAHLIGAVTHELRTPLSRMQFSLEALQQGEVNDEARRHLVALLEDVDEVDALVSELLTYARFDAGAPATPQEKLDLEALAHASLHRLEPRTQALSVAVVGNAPAVMGSPRYAQRVLDNLVQNAVRHAHSSVRIGFDAVGGGGHRFARVTVEDDGEGVPQSHRAHIFEAFGRVEESRSRRFGGAGLGLAIVKRIVEHHGGHVCVDDSPEGGARFRVLWPTEET